MVPELAREAGLLAGPAYKTVVPSNPTAAVCILCCVLEPRSMHPGLPCYNVPLLGVLQQKGVQYWVQGWVSSIVLRRSRRQGQEAEGSRGGKEFQKARVEGHSKKNEKWSAKGYCEQSRHGASVAGHVCRPAQPPSLDVEAVCRDAQALQ